MAEQTAQFRFNAYKILDCSIFISEEIDISKQISINFEQTFGDITKGNEYRHTLVASIEDDNKALSIKVKAIGFFEFDNIPDEQMRMRFSSTNAPAILFPYVRAYISSLTALSGISPITLPTLNLSKR